MKLQLLLVPGLFITLSCALPAASINGTFSIDGSITVSLNNMNWVDNSNVAEMFVVGPPNPTGSWATMALDTEGTEQDLVLSSEPVGGSIPQFSLPDFMTFPGPGPQSTISITLTYIYQGSGSSAPADCDPNGTPQAGQTCTPNDANGTPGPFTLVNSSSATTSTAYWTFFGTAHDSSGTLSDTSIIGQYSANFAEPYQDVLKTLASDLSVSNTYSATFTAGVPEPDTLQLFGIGLLLCLSAVAFRRVKAVRSR